MRSSATRAALAIVAVGAAVTVCIAAALSFEPVRAELVRTGLSTLLTTRGFALRTADVHFGGGHLAISNLAIDDYAHTRFLTAAKVDVGYRRRGLHFSLASLTLDRAHLVLRREADGLYNAQHLMGATPAPSPSPVMNPSPTPAPPIKPVNIASLHALVKVNDTSVDFQNPYSPGRPGRALSVNHINMSAHLDGGNVSTGSLVATLSSPGERSATVHGSFLEDDRTRFATLHATALAVPIAPLLDLFISSPAFIAQQGTASLRATGYAIDWPSDTSPHWHVLARGSLANARLALPPLAVPARNVAGPLRFMDGMLSLPKVTGSAAAVPMTAFGSITILPTVSLDIHVHMAGALHNAKRLLSFSAPLPLQGPIDVLARVDGSPSDPRVAVGLKLPNGANYQQLHVAAAQVALVYYRQHVTLPLIAGSYQGFAVFGSGDVDVGKKTPDGQFALALRGPSGAIPWLANIEDRGLLSARAAMSGPVTALAGSGFVRLSGPDANIRTTFTATPTRLGLGPMVAFDQRGGSMWMTAGIDRTRGHALDADLVVNRFAVALNDRRTVLPGVFNRPFGMPQMSALLGGAASVTGSLAQPTFEVTMHEQGLTVQGTRYGDLNIKGLGAAGIAWLNLQGRSLRIAGIPVGSVSALAGWSPNAVHLYAARAHFAGGDVALSGDLALSSGARRKPIALVALVRSVDLSQLRSMGLPVSAGTVSAMGIVRGTERDPQASLSAIVADADLAGRSLGADAHVNYGNATLVLGNSRVLLGGGSAVTAHGVIAGVHNLNSLSSARLDIVGSADEADIAALAGSSMPAAFPVTGSVDATVHISGTASAPAVAGTLDSASGTVRGVYYRNLAAGFSVAGRTMSLQGGHVQMGTSAIDADGTLAPGRAAVRVASPHMDLADFNDFFNGKDVLDGTGSFEVAVNDAGSASGASGNLRFRDMQVAGLPVGTVNGKVWNRSGAVVAVVRQDSPLAHGFVNATAALPSRGMADFGHAYYNVSASEHDIDMGSIAMYLPVAEQGIRGRLDVDAAARGPGENLAGDVAFNLRQGFFGKQPIQDFSGRIFASRQSIAVRPLTVALGGLSVGVNGSYQRSGRIAGHALIRAANLQQAASLAGMNAPISGSATLALDASGSLRQPMVHAQLSADSGAAYGIKYQHLGVDTAYAPGAVRLRNATLLLPKSQGSVVASGVAPVPYGPRREDPPGKPAPRIPLDMTIHATGLDLSALNPLLGPRGSLGGKIDLQASARGSLAKPRLSGNGSLRNGSVHSQLDTVPITGMSAALAFDNDTMKLTSFHATLGKGSMQANGVARLGKSVTGRSPGRVEFSGRMVATNANIDVPKFFSGQVSADLSLQSKPQPALAGNVDLNNTTVPFAGILALASGTPSGPPQSAIVPGVPPLQKGHIIWYGGAAWGGNVFRYLPPAPAQKQSLLPATPLALDLNVSAGKNVQTTGLVNVTATGALHVGGTTAAPVLQGGFDAVRGQIGLFNTTFDLERARVRFHPSDGFLPSVDAVATAFRPEAQVTITVEGRVDQMQTSFESDPPMSQDAIMADILGINQINQALAGGGTGEAPVNAGNVVGSVITNQLLAGLDFGLEQALDIQEINLAVSSNGTPSLELRKQYGHDIYAMFRESFATPPQQAYGMVYVVRNYLELDFEQQNNPQGLLGNEGFLPPQQTTFQATYRFAARRITRRHKPAASGPPLNKII